MTDNLPARPRLTNDELRALNADNIMAFFESKQATITDLSAVLGSGFTVLPTDDKFRLLNSELIIVEWHFAVGDNGEFVSLAVVTKDGQKLIVNDGSTGIRDQVKDLEARGIFPPVLVSRGLRVSEYYYDPNDSDKKSRTQVEGYRKATTYYLAV